jgi:hypothetical protein
MARIIRIVLADWALFLGDKGPRRVKREVRQGSGRGANGVVPRNWEEIENHLEFVSAMTKSRPSSAGVLPKASQHWHHRFAFGSG